MDGIEVYGQRIMGALKTCFGKVIGDAKLRTDGAAEESRAASAETIAGMDKDRVEGIAHEMRGAAKQAYGALTGDVGMEDSGKGERARGAIQNEIGGARDAAREAADNTPEQSRTK